jgi:hypothetical protein
VGSPGVGISRVRIPGSWSPRCPPTFQRRLRLPTRLARRRRGRRPSLSLARRPRLSPSPRRRQPGMSPRDKPGNPPAPSPGKAVLRASRMATTGTGTVTGTVTGTGTGTAVPARRRLRGQGTTRRGKATPTAEMVSRGRPQIEGPRAVATVGIEQRPTCRSISRRGTPLEPDGPADMTEWISLNTEGVLASGGTKGVEPSSHHRREAGASR